MQHCEQHTEKCEDIARAKLSAESAHDRIDAHETWLTGIDNTLDVLVKSDTKHTMAIDNLCKRIDGLISSIKWLIGMMLGAGAGFVIWLIQQIIKQ